MSPRQDRHGRPVAPIGPVHFALLALTLTVAALTVCALGVLQ